jgi:protein CpxP
MRLTIATMSLLGALSAFAQGPAPPRPNRPPMERAMQRGPGGRWWDNPEMAEKLSLTSDQQKKMDDIFQQNRLRLIDLTAALQKEEITLEPLLDSDTPDEPKILAQIDRVAQSRAELEKANARFLLGIRRVLTAEQWKKLQAEGPPGRPGGPGGPGGPSPGGPRGPARGR